MRLSDIYKALQGLQGVIKADNACNYLIDHHPEFYINAFSLCVYVANDMYFERGQLQICIGLNLLQFVACGIYCIVVEMRDIKKREKCKIAIRTALEVGSEKTAPIIIHAIKWVLYCLREIIHVVKWTPYALGEIRNRQPSSDQFSIASKARINNSIELKVIGTVVMACYIVATYFLYFAEINSPETYIHMAPIIIGKKIPSKHQVHALIIFILTSYSPSCTRSRLYGPEHLTCAVYNIKTNSTGLPTIDIATFAARIDSGALTINEVSTVKADSCDTTNWSTIDIASLKSGPNSQALAPYNTTAKTRIYDEKAPKWDE